MKAILRKTFHSDVQKDQSAPATPQILRPSAQDILRYRYHHGTNLGGIFVLEKWLHGSMFDVDATGDSESDAVTAYATPKEPFHTDTDILSSSIKIRGIEATRAQWEAHWSNALSDSDLDWLSDVAHCTTIRLPIGYFTLGPEFCDKTPFANQPARVYQNAWAAVKDLVARCYRYGIGVLLDFHALPGGANGETHSGTSSGKALLWSSKTNINLSLKCVERVAREIADGMDGVVGLQLCNEAGWESLGLYQFYDAALARVSQIDGSLPIYISDAWDLKTALRYSLDKNGIKGSLSNPVIVDTHQYYTFADKDTSRHPQELISQVSTELLELRDIAGGVFDRKGAVAAFVGEYSCTLSGNTWNKVRPEDRAPLTQRLGHTQSHIWQERSCGSAFWTFKMDWMPGGDWGFKQQVDNGNVLAPRNLALSAAEVRERSHAADARRTRLMEGAVQSHQSYWDQKSPGGQFEHWRFAEGWHLGWHDARAFFCARSDSVLAPDDRQEGSETPQRHVQGGGDKIGALDLWVLIRIKEAKCADKRTCSFGWEWEQGFRSGVDRFYSTVGI